MLRLPLSILVLLAACGSDSKSPVGDGGPPATDASADADNSGGLVFTAKFGPFEVPPGEESTKCIITKVNNERAVHIGEIHNVLGATSHHYIVYRISEGEVSDAPFDCQPFLDTLDPTKGAPLMVTQRSDEVLTLPEGVGFSFEPNQLVRLELHYINASDSVQNIEVESTFTSLANSDFEYEADFLFIGNPDIQLAPGQSSQLTTNFLPTPADLAGAKIFGITGHTHQWGTDVEVAVKTGANGPETMLYDVENFLWDEPETKRLDPEYELQANDGFRFHCTWNNGSGQQVNFGEGVNDEMCFFWAYYYPSKGSRVCVHTDQAPDIATDVCCPGDALCALIDNFLGQ